jgi:hypothetical protein
VLLEPVEWTDDTRFDVNGHGFEFVRHDAMPDPPTGRFSVYKWRELLEAYNELLSEPVESMVELGVWHGGGTVLFNELLHPQRLVALDVQPVNPSPEFSRYLAVHDEVSVHWGVHQEDGVTLRSLVTGPLDLVIDDASHEYDNTAASFDVLFPMLRPGGWYVIEDWGWPFVEEHAEGAYKTLRSLSDLLLDIAALTISRGPGWVKKVLVVGSFIAVERGDAEITALDVRSDHYKRSDYREAYAQNPDHGAGDGDQIDLLWRDVKRRLRRRRPSAR